MSVSTQYAPGTPYNSEYLDVDNIFDQFFNEGSTESESKNCTSPSSTSPPSDPPSAHPGKAEDSSSPSIVRSREGSPQLFDISSFDDQQMEHLWNDFGLEDNVYRGTSTSQGPTENQLFYTTSSGTSMPALTPMPSMTSLPSMGTIQPREDGEFQPQYLSPQNYQNPKSTIHSPLQTLVSGYPSNTQAVHGQVTPVEDNQQSVPVFPPDIFNDGHYPSQLDSPPQSTRGSSSPKQPSRRSRKNSKSSREADEAQEAKRKRFLERNRVAASKCRQKKKEWMQNLEENARRAQSTSKFLQHTVGVLKDELLILKQELLKHHGCDCAKIRTYLMQEAEKVVVDQQRKSSIADTPAPPKSRQLSIAESEMSEMSELNVLADELDFLAEDAMDDSADLRRQ